jgi:DNA-binding MarR family transcriptional regulator
MSVAKFAKVIDLLQKQIKRDLPLTWIELLLKVAEAGDRGAHSPDLAKEIGVAQGVISRTVKLLSTHWDEEAGKMIGPDLVTMSPDPVHRHRLAIRLTKKGKALITKIEEALA